MISDTDSSAKSVKDEPSSVHDKKNKKKSDRDTKNVKKEEEEDDHGDRRKKRDKDREEKKKGKGKDKPGPMHFTASAEPVAISQEGDFEGDLPEEIFVEVRVLLLETVFTMYFASV